MTQVAAVIVAIAILFFMLDSYQPEFLMQHGRCLTESAIDEGPLGWGMRFFLLSLAVGLIFIAIVFFLSFRDD
ncbi:hypothetical protein [Enterobacillus tribolii]|uniref:hypothetical protein n=1 Tax=Enterobacillus tribolii TaxID=1487935 RepID=UPI000E1C7DBC|nr:hypothetical protein [Enterobacillus tribolii]MBW7983021.1 hypothetical protein [Enterobacillus tribolii]